MPLPATPDLGIRASIFTWSRNNLVRDASLPERASPYDSKSYAPLRTSTPLFTDLIHTINLTQ